MGYLKLRNDIAPGSAGRLRGGFLGRAPGPAVFAVVALLLTGCRLDMHLQPKYLPYEPTDFFADGRSERPPVRRPSFSIRR